MTLDAIEGQPRAVALLRRTLESGRVAHAYAFLGPAGSGRTTTALAFAQALLCDDGQACGRCRACRLVAARQHPDLHLIVPTPPERNPRGARAIRIDAIRELERQAALRPALGRSKVFVVDDAERMTGESPQAFLKTLEEPPAHTVIVLVLPHGRTVPATVLSRCQIVRFVARGEGRPADDHAEVVALLEDIRTGGIDARIHHSAGVDRERAEALLDACWLLFRDLLVARSAVPAHLLAHAGQAEALGREARRWTDDELLGALQVCREASRALAVNVTPRLTIEMILSRLARPAA